MSTVTGKTVNFHIYVGNSLSQRDAAKQEHLNPLENSVVQLGQGLVAAINAQQYMRGREETHAKSKHKLLFLCLFEKRVCPLFLFGAVLSFDPFCLSYINSMFFHLIITLQRYLLICTYLLI